MLFITRNTSRGRPEHFIHTENGFTFEMTTVPKATEHTSATISVKVTESLPFAVFFKSVRRGYGGKDIGQPETTVSMIRDPDNINLYHTEVTASEKGGRLLYYFEAEDSHGRVLATFKTDEGQPFVFKYIGEVPVYILAPHILFIFATFFFVSLATINSLDLIRGKSVDARPMATCMLWAVIFSLLGCYPFGIPMNWYAFGATWEGVPFGTDATDNKTQLLCFYLAYVLLSGLGSLTNGRFGRNLYLPKTLGWLGVSAFGFLMFIFLIPHSIQFSAALTYSFCYSVLGLIILTYIVGYIRASGSGRTALRG